MTVRGQFLGVEIETDGVTYNLEQGDGLTVYHRGERLDLRPGKPVRRSWERLGSEVVREERTPVTGAVRKQT